MEEIKIKTRINDEIRAKKVRVIGVDSENLGVMGVGDALGIAEELGLDLVEVDSRPYPPVCKIIDYGKFKYDEKKRQKRQRKKDEVKTIKFRPFIDTNDFNIKCNKISKFLDGGAKVKVEIVFRRRELRNPHNWDTGANILNEIVEKFDGCNVISREGKKGQNISLTLSR